MVAQKIILDCDPGHDDAVAIMLAGKHPSIELLGITVVSGNQTLDNTVRNALNVVQTLELDVPVFGGCDRPIVREKIVAGDIHGDTGLDGPIFPHLNREAESIHAIQFIVDTLLKSDENITIVTTGPMTNLAMAIRLEPRIVSKINNIMLMGGSYANGNVTPAAEFNIFADAEAAHICFTCGCPITMVGLDVTRQALCYPDIVERMGKLNNSASNLFVDLMEHFCKTQKEVFGWDGGPLHDPIVIAQLIDPTVLTLKPMYTTIDIRGIDSYGRTNCDYFNYLKKEATAMIAIGIDVSKFWDIVESTLSLYSH